MRFIETQFRYRFSTHYGVLDNELLSTLFVTILSSYSIDLQLRNKDKIETNNLQKRTNQLARFSSKIQLLRKPENLIDT